MAEVLAAVTADTHLTASRRRDLVSAVRSTGRLCRLPLSSLPAQPSELRPRLDAIHPAAFNMSAKRYANIKADLARALEIGNPALRAGPPWPPLDDEWRLMRDRCPSPWLDLQLRGFMRWCSNRGTRANEVDRDTLDAYLRERSERKLKLDVVTLRRRIARAWNQCVETAVNWPKQKLQPAPTRERWTMPWPDFHPEFQREVDRWAEGLASVDLLDDDAPIRPLKPITIRQRRHHVQAAATTLVASGVPVEELRTLQDLVRPERVAVVLNGLRRRYGCNSPTPYNMAVTLKMIARHTASRARRRSIGCGGLAGACWSGGAGSPARTAAVCYPSRTPIPGTASFCCRAS